MPKILGIFLKISGLMENPDPGTDADKTAASNDPGILISPSEQYRIL